MKSLISISLAKNAMVFWCAFSVSLAVVFFTDTMVAPANVETPDLSETEIHQPPTPEDVYSERSDQSPYKTVQSESVDFPGLGRIEIEAQESRGLFPRMVFRSKNGLLLQSTIQDKDRVLIVSADSELSQPILRFKVIRSPKFSVPVVMAVGLDYGGSGNSFFLTLFTVWNGKLYRLNAEPFSANIPGGFYVGPLPYGFVFGVVIWNSVWEDGSSEPFYGKHHYEVNMFQIERGGLAERIRSTSNRTYDWNNGAASLGEFGMKARDQRKDIPVIRDALE